MTLTTAAPAGGLSGSALKWIALLTMLIDHIGAVLLEPMIRMEQQAPLWLLRLDVCLRFIGRISFPIFCFLLVEGFLHSSNRKKYALRLFLFALISEIPFNLGLSNQLFNASYQNVFFTLLIGFFTLWAMEALEIFCLEREKLEKFHLFVQLFPVGIGMLIAWLLKTDYSFYGILLIAVLYFFRNQKSRQMLFGALALLWEPPAILAFFFLRRYNGTRGASMKYFFYLFYPVHLLLLTALRYFIY